VEHFWLGHVAAQEQKKSSIHPRRTASYCASSLKSLEQHVWSVACFIPFHSYN